MCSKVFWRKTMADISLTASMRSNLLSLQQTQSLMDTTQERLSTGKKVNSAIDNPSSYYTAQSLTNRASDLSSLLDSMGQAVQTIQAANEGIEAITEFASQAKAIANSANDTSDGASIENYMKQFDEILKQIDGIAKDSGYKGVNLLGGKDQELKVVFNEDRSSYLTINGTFADTSDKGLKISRAEDWTNPDNEAIDASISELENAITSLRNMASEFGNNYSIVENRENFTESLINVLEEGSDKLTLADMNEESANMLALQTRQQLAINSLSLASQAAQSVLSLF